MYLYKKVYIGVGDTVTVTHNNNVKGTYKNVRSFTQEVMYWRKANQIFRWFEKNVCDDSVCDDCKDYLVSYDKIEELIDTCEEVLNNHDKAPELLPTHTGFFFGSLEYDDWYFKELQYTVDELKKIEDDGNDFIYRAWW